MSFSKHIIIAARTATMLTIGFAAQAGAASYPPIPLPNRPTPLPQLPETFAPFAPPVGTLLPPSGAPTLAEWTRSNEPGDTLALTGSRLSTFGGEEAGRDSCFIVFGQTAAATVTALAHVQRISGRQAAITLPDTLPSPAMYVLWPVNNQGTGHPALLNRTEAWWVGPNEPSRGERVSVFGRNLTAGPDSTTSWIYLQPIDGSGRWLTSQTANPYKADFIVPADAPSGTYRVWIHNGLGQHYGWSGPMNVTVRDTIAWEGPILDVTDFGATGDGDTDDITAIDAAIDAAGAIPGSTVCFPKGTYMISRVIRDIPDNTRIQGAGMDATIIAAHSTFTTNGYGMLFGRNHDVVFEDFTLDTRGKVTGILRNNVAFLRDSTHLTFTNVRFQQHTPNTYTFIVDIHKSSMISFRNCAFIAANPMMLGSAKQVFIDGCDFRGIHDANSLIYNWGADQVSIVNSTAADYDTSSATGWAQGRFLTGNGAWGSIKNLYFGSNRTIDLTVRPDFANQNTGEQFMFEGLQTHYRGTPLAAESDTIQLPNLSEDFTGEVLIVVGGTGMGQNRIITAYDEASGTLSLNETWHEAPGNDSVVMIGHYMSRIAVFNNVFDGKDRAVTSESHTATSGVQPYGGCVDLVVARNHFHELRTALSVWSIARPTITDDRNTSQPNYFNLFTNNTFERCRRGIEVYAAVWNSLPVVPDTAILGNVFRKSRMDNITTSAVQCRNWASDLAIELCLFDQNTATNIGTAVLFETTGGLNNHIFVQNRFSGAGGTAMTLEDADCPVIRENTWDGFDIKPPENIPASILEVPLRILDFSCPIGQDREDALLIWNSGTQPLNWQAATTSNWIEISTPTGTVPDENCSGALLIKTSTADLEPGRYETIVTIETEYQSQQITVTLDATLPQTSTPMLIAFVNTEQASLDESIPQWLSDHGLNPYSTVDQDNDQDGYSLLEEYAFDLDPHTPSQSGLVRLERGSQPGTLAYVFTRARAGLTYTVERCTDLCQAAWVPIAVNPGTVGQEVALPVTPEHGHTTGFFRMTLSAN